MKVIESIFENYKACHNEETPCTEEQQAELDDLSCLLEEVVPVYNPEAYKWHQLFFDNAVSYARESEKNGFVTGFTMAINLMLECAL